MTMSIFACPPLLVIQSSEGHGGGGNVGYSSAIMYSALMVISGDIVIRVIIAALDVII